MEHKKRGYAAKPSGLPEDYVETRQITLLNPHITCFPQYILVRKSQGMYYGPGMITWDDSSGFDSAGN